MGKSVNPPPTPDYAAAAQAQGAANSATSRENSVLNNPNIYTPGYFQENTFDDAGRPVIHTGLDAAGTQTFNQNEQAQLGLASLANQQTQNIGGILNTPFSFGGTPQQSLTSIAPINISSPDFTRAQGGVTAPNLQTSLDESGVAKSPINAGTTAQQAIMSRLQPQIERNRASQETQLMNQGLRRGDEAYTNAQTDLGQQENDLYSQAALQGLNLDLAANQQGFGQAAARGQFGNDAQNSGFQNALTNQQAGNQANQQNFQNLLNSQQGYNQAQQQGYNQQLQGAQFGNTALQQALSQGLQLRDLPLNEISALLSGSQVQNPQAGPYAQSTAAPAPLFQAAAGQDAFNQNLYNQQVAQRNSGLSGLFGLGGAVLGGPLGGMIGNGIKGLFQ